MHSLGLDLDGCLYNWHISIYEYYKLYHNFVGSFNLFCDEIASKLSKEDWDYLCDVDIHYSSQPPTNDCMDFLNYVKYRYDLYYITSRPLYVKTTTEQYLKRYDFPFRDNLIFTTDKVNMARLLKLDYCIDDMPHHVEGLSKVTKVIMIAQPWNKYLWDVYPTAHSMMSATKFLETQ